MHQVRRKSYEQTPICCAFCRHKSSCELSSSVLFGSPHYSSKPNDMLSMIWSLPQPYKIGICYFPPATIRLGA